MKRATFEIRSWRLLIFGLSLILLSLTMPLFLRVDNFHVYDQLGLALHNEESVYVVSAAVRLLALNILRAYPHYLGAFCVADAVRQKTVGKVYRLVYLSLIAMIVVAVYWLIEALYGIRYDLGVPSVLMVLCLFLLALIDFAMVSPTKKAIMVFFLLCTVQCLDVMPALNGYGFGRGEASESIKEIAAFLGAEYVLNAAMTFIMLVMGINVALYTALVSDENRIKSVSLLREQQEHELMKARLQATEARAHLELDQLVHDLKSPLTAIQTLVGIVKLDEQNERHIEQLTQAEGCVERMNELISEFLDEAHFSHTTVGEIVKDLKSQISTMEYAPIVSYCVPDGSVALEVNKIRVSRMLVNLIENAYYAIDHEHGAIRLTAGPRMYEGTEMVCFALSDNGIGMDEKTQHSAFDSGFSGRGSSGLGLSFVQQVVECHHGAIRLCSKPGEGTTFYIYFPKEN